MAVYEQWLYPPYGLAASLDTVDCFLSEIGYLPLLQREGRYREQ
jgi:hypothetical protein